MFEWYASLPAWAQEILPLSILLGCIAIVFARLPRIDMGHSKRYLSRRRWNWLPLGLTYAFLYMGRSWATRPSA